jgi:hypothetical protein
MPDDADQTRAAVEHIAAELERLRRLAEGADLAMLTYLIDMAIAEARTALDGMGKARGDEAPPRS